MVALLRFCFKKTTLKSKFSEFLFTSKRPLGGYFHWNACAYFQKICCLTRYSNTKLIETFQTIWSHSSVFAFEEQLKNLNFQSFFTSKRPSGGYFQWNVCTYFQKICSWTRYSNAKLIKTFQNFLVALLDLCFGKIT